MIQTLKALKIRPINRISPSQCYSAFNCPYKLVLANSFGFDPILPMNSNAHFGNIMHKMIELISKGVIIDEQSFSDNWRDLINKKENELKNKGLSNLTPLKYFVTDFALKKNQLRNILQSKKDKIDKGQRKTTSSYYPEMKLTNLDNTITGIADLVIKNGNSVIIIDFKTGNIYTDSIDEYGSIERIIKREYETQLKLYAHLYYLMHGVYPSSLFLVTLDNDFIDIPFTKKDCESIYQEAVAFLSTINNFIKNDQFDGIAKPSEENCKYCAYRPACIYFSSWLITNYQQVNDLTGILKSVTLFNNNSLGLQLQVDSNEILISELPGGQKQGFENLLNKKVTLYNVRKSKQSLNATANNFTIVYE
jgi:hypothetical protein